MQVVKSLVLLTFVLLVGSATAQLAKENNIWYFGYYAGLDFNSGSPIALPPSAMDQGEGCASIADWKGNLLFYTDGMTVWDKTHNPMSNGTGLGGSWWATQSALIVPQPDSPDEYFIFTTDGDPGYPSGPIGFHYSKVDMSLNGGLGAVVQKNVLLLPGPSSEQVTSTKHANGRDVWVISHNRDTSYYAFLVDNNGVQSTPVTSNVGIMRCRQGGEMKVSPLGHQIVMVPLQYEDSMEVASFDNTTGLVSNAFFFMSDTVSSSLPHPYGVAFSPSGQYLYLSEGNSLYQYDLQVATRAAIEASAVLVGANTSWYRMGSLQNGPDGKIYIAAYYRPWLSAIKFPDLPGILCQYDSAFVTLPNIADSRLGLPAYVHVSYRFMFEQLCLGDSTHFYTTNTSAIDSVHWDFGDPSSGGANTATGFSVYHQFTSADTFRVTMIYFQGGASDTAQRDICIIDQTVTVNLGPDTTICWGDSLVLKAFFPDATYLWQNGYTADSFIVQSPGTYWVKVMGTCNTAIDTIVIDPFVTAGFSAPQGCVGESMPFTDLSTSQDSIVSWQWSFAGQGTSTQQNPVYTWQTFGFKSVTLVVTTVTGCSHTIIKPVLVKPVPALSVSGDTAICIGSSAQLSSTGSGTFSWSPTSTLNDSTINNPVATPSVSTMYTVSLLGPNGCISTDSVTLIVVDPVVDAGADVTMCEGEPTQLIATSPNAIAAWSWSPSIGLSDPNVANPIASPTSTTTYTITLTDTLGCITSDDVTITFNPAPQVTITPDTAMCDGASVQLNVQGPAGSQYYWDVNGAGLNCYFCPNPVATPTSTTTYAVTVEDISGCTKDTNVTVTVIPLPLVDAGVDVAVCNGASTTLAATGAANYTWQPGGMTTASITITPTSTTTYTVTGTDNFGCQNTDDVVVTVTTLPVVDAGPDQSICDGAGATLTAAGAATYTWDPGTITGATITVTPTSTTTYTVAGVDANGCENTDDVTVMVNALPVVDAGVDQTICENSPTALTATGAVNYTWEPGTLSGSSIIITPTSTTTYTVTGIDANGCANTDSVSITVNPLPTVTASATDTELCEGESTTLTAIGANNYVWNPGGVGASITVSPMATVGYIVTGTDNNGCQDTTTIVITVHPLPTVDAGVDQDICFGESATLTASGASTYIWQPTGQTTSSIATTPTSTETHTVTGTDANGCSNTDEVTVTVLPIPVVDAGQDVEICQGDQITLTATGADTYVWNTGATSPNIIVSPLITATYTVTGTDSWGCEGTDDVTVTVSAPPTVTAVPSDICKGETALLTATGALTYTWQPGNLIGDSVLVSPLATITFTVTGTDANGCENSSTVVVTVTSDCPQLEPVVQVPTAFTPNYDGLNDVFVITAEHFTLTSLRIFNRWGEVVFQTTDITEGWDGTHNNRALPIGTYVYLISGNDPKGKAVKYQGNVTVVK